ncbi:unnamed protein product [Clonostachys chloroleuca]|uniref:G-patch domain-containing protein n=1 Tax=Clonostachys chloroleuca TaxID=1926264 RepID=A0AA35PYW8_9HYPO|nr:unnamed protein product [Clonostachys chloroleuca]
MSYKRSRATFEANGEAAAPYAIFGTPLPDEAESRDDGSFVPIWKQEVRDERGRKRLHGAFTGGWSAGYFNTVGSKEGWTPSTFVSSRTNRQKDGAAKQQRRPEDYMDEEDLADAAEAQKLETSHAFAGLGGATRDGTGSGGMAGLFRTQGDTMGLKLLRRMGWKDGQGIRPKVRRTARLDMAGGKSAADGETYMFAPDDVPMIQFNRKTDRKGLGHQGEAKLNDPARGSDEGNEDDDEDSMPSKQDGRFSLFSSRKAKAKPSRTGIGVGILNDDGSDGEDPYEIGPKIKYSRVIGGDKKKKKKPSSSANPTLGNTPVFVPKLARAGNSLYRCHDGRLPLDGFVLAKLTEDIAGLMSKYAPPPVPEGWVSSKKKTQEGEGASKTYTSTADAAKASSLDPRSRAALLGESVLPGKSVFDFLSPAARDKLAAASGKTNLPPGLGEVPEEFRMSDKERQEMLWNQIPKLDDQTARAALSRSAGGPYADDELKRSRYKAYLESQASPHAPLPTKAQDMDDGTFLKEINEFYNCARIFKPMTGFMASRFTTAKIIAPSTSASNEQGEQLLSKPPPKVGDPAEEAAKMGMFGSMTRSSEMFYPTKLLCKRFNVKAPEHSRPDNMEEPDKAAAPQKNWAVYETHMAEPEVTQDRKGLPVHQPAVAAETRKLLEEPGRVDPERSEAIEGKTAHADLSDLPRSATTIPPSAALARQLPPTETVTLSGTQDSRNGPSAATDFVDALRQHAHESDIDLTIDDEDNNLLGREQSPPPQYPASEAPSSPRPPPFSSLFSPPPDDADHRLGKLVASSSVAVAEGEASSAPAYTPCEPWDPDQAVARAVSETKTALPRDTKGQSSKDNDAEPPPAYSEGDSPLLTFSYVMAAAGGASSIITQVQQGGPSLNAIGDVGADETIAMDLRGTKFVLSRDELLTLPEFVLLSLFPNGLFPEGQMGGLSEGEAVQVDYDPASLQYMLDFFRNVAQTIPAESSPSASQDGDVVPIEPLGARDDSSKRAGIIVLREDLDFYAIPPKPEITQLDMLEVKRAAARALQKQDGIFSGLKRSDEPGTTEAHLIEMLTAGGFNREDQWGHRAGEPNKAVICSLALARLRSDIRGNEVGSNAVGMAQKLLLFWRKPARRCWWEGVELENVEGVEGKLKVWIRRVWTLEMSVIGLR